MKDLASKILSRRQGASEKAARKALKAEGKPKITTGKVMKMLFMPEFGPRISQIGKRLGGFAYFLAQIFYSCRLIPAGHPVLQTANIGYFGFSDVISTAAANLQMRKENTDQIVMFAAVILSMVLVLANGLAIAAYTVFDIGGAMAQDNPSIVMDVSAAAGAASTASGAASGGLFTAPNPSTDLALQFLNRVFGASNVTFFGTGASSDGDLGSPAIKEALYAMLGIYSTAMMVIAVIIVLYYAFTVVGESAMTGQPFGKRFNSFWAPIRLVIGLGLLVPLAGGLNAAQYMTLYAAKMGSGLASYSWSVFVGKLANTNLVSDNISYPSVSGIVFNIAQFETCRAIANEYKWIDNVVVNKEVTDRGTIFRWDRQTRDGIRTAAAVGGTIGSGGNLAVGAAAGSAIGVLGDNVPAACGEIFIPKVASTIAKSDKTVMGSPEVKQSIAAMHDKYVAMVQGIIDTVGPKIDAAVEAGSLYKSSPAEFQNEPNWASLGTAGTTAITQANVQIKAAVDGFKTDYKNKFKSQVKDRITAFDDRGWMGAGMFYTQIADLNGGLLNAVRETFPRVTGKVVAIPSEEEMEKSDWFWGNGKTDGAAFDNTTMRAMQKGMTNIQSAFAQGDNPEMANARQFRQDWITMVIIDIFGGDALIRFRESAGSNPLADITALGMGLITHGFDYVVYIIGALVAGPLIQIAGALFIPATGGASIALTILATVASSALQSIATFLIFAATVGVSIGAFLYYMIPLMPFVYFFFSVVSWILEVIEAMVGLPLWALAHLRIDGDGLGQSTQTGYTIIFGIIVRPVVVLFSLIISIILYSAAMIMMREMFGVFVGTVGEGESGGGYSAIDYVAFCVVYAVIAFSLANLCFKQIDIMGNQIMRWFGGGDPRYNDGQLDPTANFKDVGTGLGYLGTQIGNKMGDAASSMSQSVGNSVADKLKPSGGPSQDPSPTDPLPSNGSGGVGRSSPSVNSQNIAGIMKGNATRPYKSSDVDDPSQE